MSQVPVAIALEDVREAAQAVVAERGSDYICAQVGLDDEEFGYAYFTMEGHPSCLVGCVLHRLGLEPIQYLPENLLDASDLRSAELIDADEVTIEYLDDLQSRQDSGFTWGSAYNYAELRQIRREHEGDHAS